MDIKPILSRFFSVPINGQSFECMTTTDVHTYIVSQVEIPFITVKAVGSQMQELGFERINFKHEGKAKKGYRVVLNPKSPPIPVKLEVIDLLKQRFRKTKYLEVRAWKTLGTILGILTKKYGKIDKMELIAALRAYKVDTQKNTKGGKVIILYDLQSI